MVQCKKLFQLKKMCGRAHTAQRVPCLFIRSQTALSIINAISLSFLVALTDTYPRISVVIPCYAGHAQHLPELLHAYELQTLLPDEIVISLSQAEQVCPEIIHTIQNGPWKFPVILLVTNEQLYAGENRNRACLNATGDIFICQDADDVPHPQRIETIDYFFTHHAVDHLMHQYIMLDAPCKTAFAFKKYKNVSQIPFFRPKVIAQTHEYSPANGNIAIKKEIFDAIKWPNSRQGQDLEFNKLVYKHSKNCILILAPLQAYRFYLSSAKQQHKKNQKLARAA